jgi:cytokinin dehydrogenase
VDPSDLAACREMLRARCRGEVFDAPAELDARATDFGGMVRVTPALVLRPACVEDVQHAVRCAGERNLTVGVRGMGHSQSGQGLAAGLLLDMTSLHRVVGLDRDRPAIEVEAGITWRAVVDATFAHGLLPVALTHALDTTVGGTLSIGGIGSAAWNYGPQVDNVVSLDVVTSEGNLVRCSLEQARDWFDVVRAGFGQFGIIVRAAFTLRPCAPMLESRTFVYQDLDDLLRDVRSVTNDPVPERLLTVRVAPDPLRAGSLMAALLVGHDVSSDDAAHDSTLPTLHASYEPPRQRHPTWTPDGFPGHSFFRAFGAPHLVAAGSQPKNPWVDFVYPMSSASAALATLAQNPSQVLHHGPAVLIFVSRGPNPAPLLVTPEDGLVMGLGVFPTFAKDDSERAADSMQSYARTMAGCGGKRYLCGYFGPTQTTDWALHFGDAWSLVCDAKRRCDRTRRFESRLVKWPAPSA